MQTDKVQPTSSNEIDPITLAIMNRRFDTVTTKMANTLLRTGRSGVLNLARDFSTSIVTRDSELLTGAESLPIHCLSGADIMSKTMLEMHPELKKGDAFLHNSPYHGCSHAADHTILVPVIDETGVHHFTVWVKVHQADCGNSQPTTYFGDALDIYHEGALIFPAVKVQENYQDIADIIRMCQMRLRVPDQWRGDFLAMIGAARVGERDILQMALEFGWDTLHSFSRQWLDYSERIMTDAIKSLPDGEASITSVHDPFPGTPDEGVAVRADLSINSADAMIEVDLSNNCDTLPCGLNLSEACARTSAMIGIFNSIEEDVPTNAGSFRRIRVKIRDNCIIGGGKHPVSMSVATTNLSDHVTNAVQRAFAEIDGGLGLAAFGSTSSAAGSVISGFDSRNKNEAYINEIFLAFTGGAATAKQDAWITICHAGNAGMSFLDSIEMEELHFPLWVKERSVIKDTEGAGRTIGAPSIYCKFGPLGENLITVSWVTDGAVNVAGGARGGCDGTSGKSIHILSDGREILQKSVSAIQVKPGEMIVGCTAGGGGYGPPWERPVEKVIADVKEGLTSIEKAETVYGVTLDESLKINEKTTKERRKILADKN